ncbi:hypothetical protein QJS10_CPB04g00884 [Acorus calamus]|uniref:F-box/LRR-repeat protein 15-like leucin rich repeat domain-containing protein n=1 Tax=Acorus calamus TaxID=4465 RepID=A0AAV9F293_ACOCL|nr:hypothetical protein QJS10_CPB04g00884 [Acorus calamus]
MASRLQALPPDRLPPPEVPPGTPFRVRPRPPPPLPLIERLDLSACAAVDDRLACATFGGWAARLRSVNLSRASAVRAEGLEAMARVCTAVEEVDLSYCCSVGDREAAALGGMAGLKDLRLVKCLGVTDVGLATIAVGCVGLERLSLKWCLKISDLGVDLLSKKCCDLKLLDISYLKVYNESMRSIASLRKLESLSIVGCSFIDDEGLAFLNCGSPSLQSIDTSRCDNVTSLGLLWVIKGHDSLVHINVGHCFPELGMPFLSKLEDLKSLKSIRLDGFKVSESILRMIGLGCKALAEIGLSKCEGVTDEGIVKLVSSCVELRTIDLTCCHLVTDISLFAIADSCKKLACLRLESCGLITENGLLRLGSCCSSLEELDLTDCSNMNDSALKCLSRCLELLVLKLGLCSSISDEGLIHIASSCKKLQELDVYRCEGIGDDGLEAIAKGCKQMKRLNICYCTQITDKGMKHLSTLEKLADLELRRLVNVTSTGITAIAMGCKSLVELDLKRCYHVDDNALQALAHYSKNLRQITISYCMVSDVGLCILLGGLRCLQDVKMVHLSHVTVEGFEIALRASWDRLKKLKLLNGLRHLLSPGLVQILQARGCRIRWVIKGPALK